MDFLSIFSEDLRGPRGTVFLLKIVHLKIAGNHGALWAKSKNFQGLVFIPKTEKLLLWHLKWKGKTNRCLGGLRMEDQRCSESSNLSGEEFLLPSSASKTCKFCRQIAELKQLFGLKKQK